MSVYLQDPDVTLHCGNALDVLRELPSESVHMCCTSPPFYGLRDYGTGSWEGGDPDCDHTPPKQPARKFTNGRGEGQGDDYAGSNLKSWTDRDGTAYGKTCGKCGAARVDQQIGLEPTPDEWVQALVAVFREVRRVLRKDGTCWIEIGDSYAAGNRTDKNADRETEFRERGQERGYAPGSNWSNYGVSSRQSTVPPGVKPKDLIGAPWLLAFALRADGWYLRSEIIWAKPNPMPESVTDRPTTSHSRVFLLAKTKDYYYDQEAVREPHSPDGRAVTGRTSANGTHDNHKLGKGERRERWPGIGRNRRSVWQIPTEPYPEAHFATWPTRLVEPMILAGTSERGVCPECGAPWERVMDATHDAEGRTTNGQKPRTAERRGFDVRMVKSTSTVGWQPTCECHGWLYRWYEPDPRTGKPELHTVYVFPNQDEDEQAARLLPATCLDVFGGSGTTAHVARKHGRHTILIELNADYCQLAADRLAQQSLLA